MLDPRHMVPLAVQEVLPVVEVDQGVLQLAVVVVETNILRTDVAMDNSHFVQNLELREDVTSNLHYVSYWHLVCMEGVGECAGKIVLFVEIMANISHHYLTYGSGYV